MDLSAWMMTLAIPAISGLVWWVWRLQMQLSELRENILYTLSEFKLDVAKNYASTQSLREVEGRLVAHLNRIEAKLDIEAYRMRASIKNLGEE
ncbi:MAG TPA: hypothetical protein PKW15_02785 [Alphaproteobacteria bacterium]|nr:hypothetical protein [Rhodospirillaceae bacterium]HRJ12151.1 hypothetical protein [Alphaproteobacteria bacterium]